MLSDFKRTQLEIVPCGRPMPNGLKIELMVVKLSVTAKLRTINLNFGHFLCGQLFDNYFKTNF